MAPFRLRAPDMDEDTLHACVKDALDTLLIPPAEWTTMPAGGYGLSAAAAGRLARLGLKRGWPDLILVHAARVYGIELKTRTGRLSKTRIVRTRRGGPRVLVGQEEMHPRLEAAGMPIAVCRSLDDVLLALRKWRVPLRAREPSARGAGQVAA